MSPFITFEGPEGSGKTTQIGLLQQALQARGIQAIYTREPGGTQIGEAVRRILDDPHHLTMVPEAEVLLYCASRAQHVAEVIRPALARGQMVFCDRFTESTLAYQGYGRGLELEELRRINAFATKGLEPDLTIYLDLDVEEGLRRKQTDRQDGHGEWNRMDEQDLAFHSRVRDGYLALAAAAPARWRIVDASLPAHALHEIILRHIEPFLRNAESLNGDCEAGREKETANHEHETVDQHSAQ